MPSSAMKTLGARQRLAVNVMPAIDSAASCSTRQHDHVADPRLDHDDQHACRRRTTARARPCR
jgi:hypothetical protein